MNIDQSFQDPLFDPFGIDSLPVDPPIKRTHDSNDQKHFEEYVAKRRSDNARNRLLERDNQGDEDLQSSQGAHPPAQSSLASLKDTVYQFSVHSSDRDKKVYPYPSQFVINLQRSYKNVKKVELVKIEFPNTASVIRSGANKVYWRNLQDIKENIFDPNTGTYPVYSVTIEPGHYSASQLAVEIGNQMSKVRRENGNSNADFHYFICEMDTRTDITKFTSLQLQNLVADPLQTTVGSGVVLVTSDDPHGFADGDAVYLINARQVAGITASTFNKSHIVQYVSPTQFTIEVNVKATDTLVGGGGSISAGQLAPFQLLFSDYTDTLDAKIGFANENSSERIDYNVTGINQVNILQVTTVTPHGISTSNRSGILIIELLNVSGLDGTYEIVDVISDTQFLVLGVAPLAQTVSSGQINYFDTLSNQLVSVDLGTVSTSVSNYILLQLESTHDYTYADNGTSIQIYDSDSVPLVDGVQSIAAVIGDDRLLITGVLLQSGTSASIAAHNPLSSITYLLSNIEIKDSTTVTLTMSEPHDLVPGDRIQVRDIQSIPSTINIFKCSSVTATTVDIKFACVQISMSPGASVGTGLLKLKFPKHSFNSLSSVTSELSDRVRFVTTNAHNLNSGSDVYINNTNCVPSVDGFYAASKITIVDTSTFDITDSGFTSLTTPGDFGIIGFDSKFQIYSAASVGGIVDTKINGVTFEVRKVIDQNNILMSVDFAYALTAESGGQDNIFISSLSHGFSGVQTNLKNGKITRSINLAGENIAYLCCPTLGVTNIHSSNTTVRNIFARVSLSEAPGTMMFDSFRSNPKVYDDVGSLERIDKLEFLVINPDGSFYDFNDTDFSFALDITETNPELDLGSHQKAFINSIAKVTAASTNRKGVSSASRSQVLPFESLHL